MKLSLRNLEFCDGCEQLVELNTLAQHKRCKLYKKVMLPRDDTHFESHGLGYIERPEICKKDNKAEKQ